MIKLITAKLSLLFLLIAITTCYYERETDALKVCFIRDYSIWTMNIDSSEQRQISFGGFNNAPSWSPDGLKILFYSNRDTNYEIYVINSDGSGLKQLTHTSSPNFNTYPTWSTDGEKIFFCEYNDPNYSIIAAESDGTIIRRYPITHEPPFLSVSPDGKYIYYVANISFYRLDIASGEQKELSLAPEQLSVSPDGKYFAFTPFAGTDFYIRDINLSSSGTLISTGTNPCWTPDGKQIVYEDGNNIYSINIDKTNKKLLTNNGTNSYPCVKWKPR